MVSNYVNYNAKRMHFEWFTQIFFFSNVSIRYCTARVRRMQTTTDVIRIQNRNMLETTIFNEKFQ